MLNYSVSAHRIDSHGSLAKTKDAQLVLDTDVAGRRDAFNLVELLLAALAACIIKGVERAIPALKFELRHLDVIVEGERPDNSPKLAAIHYDVVIDTDEPDRRLSLLQVNIEKYGTIMNTLASSVPVSGTVKRASPAAERDLSQSAGEL